MQTSTRVERLKKPFYKKWRFLIIVGLIILVLVILIPKDEVGEESSEVGEQSSVVTVEVKEEVPLNLQVVYVDYTEKVEMKDNEEPESIEGLKPDDLIEYEFALRKAQAYSDNIYLSKLGIYDRLTSKHGDLFSYESAQYAVDSLDADWNKNALKNAQSYFEATSMSPDYIYNQLISKYGERFTKEQAEFARDNL